MSKCYKFQTDIGSVTIIEFPGRVHAVFNNKKIGSFDSAIQAAEVLGLGNTFELLGASYDKLDTSKLSIPSDLSEWECLQSDNSPGLNFIKH